MLCVHAIHLLSHPSGFSDLGSRSILSLFPEGLELP